MEREQRDTTKEKDKTKSLILIRTKRFEMRISFTKEVRKETEIKNERGKKLKSPQQHFVTR